jgi:hypothetical protein
MQVRHEQLYTPVRHSVVLRREDFDVHDRVELAEP